MKTFYDRVLAYLPHDEHEGVGALILRTACECDDLAEDLVQSAQQIAKELTTVADEVAATNWTNRTASGAVEWATRLAEYKQRVAMLRSLLGAAHGPSGLRALASEPEARDRV